MKKIMFLLLSTIMWVGCSSDDNSNGGNNTGIVPDFYPEQDGTYWRYRVHKDANNIGVDSLYIDGKSYINSVQYTSYGLKHTPKGFYSGILDSGQTRIDGSKFIYYGALDLQNIFPQLTGYSILLEDFVFFDNTAPEGQQLDSRSGSQTISYQNGIDFVVEYTISSKAGAVHNNLNVLNNNYNQVRSSVFTLSAKVKAKKTILGVPITYTILETQDVAVSTQHFKDGIGMIFANTDIQYELADFPNIGVTVPFPQYFEMNIKESLINYNLQ
ncbi:MAG: hypothetical protein Q4B43_08340 [Bacteroidota bacterium]|nr:hypothetical protein [Bacteroidota bacterium]